MAEKIDIDSESSLPGGPSPFGSFVERNQKLIAAGVAIAIIAGAGWGISALIRKTKYETAALDLAAAKTPEALQAVATQHADTPSGPTARFLLAEEQWGKGQQAEAIDNLRTLLSASPHHPSATPARASLASKLLAQGSNLDEAKSLFNQIASDSASGYLGPYALIRLSEMARTAGDFEEAAKDLARAHGSEFGSNSFGQLVERHEKVLKFKEPTEVDAPPPPAAPPAPVLSPGAYTPQFPGSLGGGSTLPTAPASPTTGNPLLKDLGLPTAPEPASPEPADPTPGSQAPAIPAPAPQPPPAPAPQPAVPGEPGESH